MGNVDRRYCTPANYKAREKPEYFHDDYYGVVWQPDVYREAARIALAVGALRLIDIGCGHGRRLAVFRGRFDLIGIDFGGNIELCRQEFPTIDWRVHDLDSEEEPLPVSSAESPDAVLICSDVIEHLVRPELLLGKIHQGFDRGASAAILSTPERNLWRGMDHRGPPPNTAHVREWALAEFSQLLRNHEFEHTALFLTRSNNLEDEHRTILAVVFRDEETASKAPVPRSRPTPVWEKASTRGRRWVHYQGAKAKRTVAKLGRAGGASRRQA